MTLPFFPRKPITPSSAASGPRRCNEPGPLRRQMCIVGPQARQTDPGCAGCSQLNPAGPRAVWFEDTEQ